MWLLSASRAELHYFHSPEDEQLQRDGGYAILSHVWNKTTDLPEQTFQDLQELQRQCAAVAHRPFIPIDESLLPPYSSVVSRWTAAGTESHGHIQSWEMPTTATVSTAPHDQYWQQPATVFTEERPPDYRPRLRPLDVHKFAPSPSLSEEWPSISPDKSTGPCPPYSSSPPPPSPVFRSPTSSRAVQPFRISTSQLPSPAEPLLLPSSTLLPYKSFPATSSTLSPRDLACEKIRRCCELAERHGFKWVWIDTCCIDKSSSAELSEAINSMYQYYALARLCYAYLKDVEMPPTYPGLAGRRRLPPQFHRSRWHTRGWTLQELIAPQVVLFLSQSWSILGSKADLAQELENITRVPAKVLTLEISPAVMSIAQRMSWVAGRETTRIEDEAYCLMGIFDINMPTLYGEGRRAFRRLQEEIMKRTSDTTIFAWGWVQNATDTRLGAYGGEPIQGASRLFAARPVDFAQGSGVTYTPLGVRNSFLLEGNRNRLLSFSVTPHGVRARIPIHEDSSSGLLLADLSCSDNEGASIFLVLSPYANPSHPNVPFAKVGRHPIYENHLVAFRTKPDTSWSEIFISDTPTSLITHKSLIPPVTLSWLAPIRISPTLAPYIWSVRNAGLPWPGQLPVVLTMTCPVWMAVRLRYVVLFGRCTAGAVADSSGGSLWVRATSETDLDNHTHHLCPEDHISTWPGLRAKFLIHTWVPDGLSAGRLADHVHFDVALTFAPCPWSPTSTYVLQDVNVDTRQLISIIGAAPAKSATRMAVSHAEQGPSWVLPKPTWRVHDHSTHVKLHSKVLAM